jgi:hypothetical protein
LKLTQGFILGVLAVVIGHVFYGLYYINMHPVRDPLTPMFHGAFGIRLGLVQWLYALPTWWCSDRSDFKAGVLTVVCLTMIIASAYFLLAQSFPERSRPLGNITRQIDWA